MSTVAETPRVAAKPKPRPGRRPAPVAGGVLWILVLGGLLAGVVAVNVVVLQLNVRLDRLGGERSELRADIATLESRLSSAAAAARIERDARTRLGLEPADARTTRYVRLGDR